MMKIPKSLEHILDTPEKIAKLEKDIIAFREWAQKECPQWQTLKHRKENKVMTQEEKQLLLKDLSARLPYGVKILHTGWDYDSDTDFDTVETLTGIDDRFIYTVWDKTGDREKHCLSVSNWKPYLRPMSSMTKEERKEYHSYCDYYYGNYFDTVGSIDWLNAHHFDYRGLIEKGLAIAVTKENNPYKNLKI